MAARLFDQNNELRLNIAAPILLLSHIAAQREARRHAMKVLTRRELSYVPIVLFQILHGKIMPNESSSFHEPLDLWFGV